MKALLLAGLLAAGCAGEPVFCTMEAKACPDGSYVGRDPARSCEFKPCPSAHQDRGKPQ
jgi:hypothetical protein